METLKYTIIKSEEQYHNYCNILEQLTDIGHVASQDEVELLTLLIEKWDNEHNTLNDCDPIELLKALMLEHKMKARDLADVLDLTKGTVSKILSYNKGLSKDVIRTLSGFFKISQEAFNRPYQLVSEENRHVHKNQLGNAQNHVIAV